MSEVRRILQHALPGKNSNLQRRIERAERLERIIFQRFRISPWNWQAKHIRWFFAVPAKDWSDTSRYDAWRELRAVLVAVGKAHVAKLVSSSPKADFIRPNGSPGRLAGVGRPPKLAAR